MFCPTCAHENQAEIKFCTRCGTNLAAVSEALAGTPGSPVEVDDRMVKLLTKYYDGRRSTAVGGVSLSIGTLMIILLLAARLNWENIPLPALLLIALSTCALVFGAIAVIGGVVGWIQSSSEMNALGFSAPAKRIANIHRLHLSTSSAEQLTRSQAEYATDPISFPATVTEQTTRQLEEHSFSPTPKESNQTN
ncbi:MAG TPA: zinc ribbon domain-containing protein [Blastocatellia bacterium]|nr:zinc ribbon domain-containing protein [Blastocatellia bacterium]